MKILDRYIGRAVYGGTALSLGVLVAMFSFFVLVDTLGDVGRGNFGVGSALGFVLLSMPTLAYDILPMAALIGSLLGLGALANHSELVVVRCAGVSLLRVIGAVMKAGLVIMLAGIVLGEVVAPFTESWAQEGKARALSNQAALIKTGGLWARDGSTFINIRNLRSDTEVENVRIYEFDDAYQLRTATTASKAVFEDDAWILSGVKQSHISTERVTTAALDKARWTSRFGPDLVEVAVDKPQQLSVWGLARYIHYLRLNGQDSSPYELDLWKKIISPISTGVMIFLAVPFVFGPLRSVTIGQRILVGVIVGISFHIIGQTFIKLGLVYGLTPFFAAVIPVLGALLLGSVMLLRAR